MAAGVYVLVWKGGRTIQAVEIAGCSLAAGIGLWRRQNWGRWLGIVLIAVLMLGYAIRVELSVRQLFVLACGGWTIGNLWRLNIRQEYIHALLEKGDPVSTERALSLMEGVASTFGRQTTTPAELRRKAVPHGSLALLLDQPPRLTPEEIRQIVQTAVEEYADTQCVVQPGAQTVLVSGKATALQVHWNQGAWLVVQSPRGWRVAGESDQQSELVVPAGGWISVELIRPLKASETEKHNWRFLFRLAGQLAETLSPEMAEMVSMADTASTDSTDPGAAGSSRSLTVAFPEVQKGVRLTPLQLEELAVADDPLKAARAFGMLFPLPLAGQLRGGSNQPPPRPDIWS